MTEQKREPKIVIDRSKWRCGRVFMTQSHGKGETKLLNDEGYKCCLGFACEQVGGFSEDDIRSIASPSHLADKLKIKSIPYFADRGTAISLNSELSINAMRVNDNVHYSHHEREDELVKLFDENGIKLSFTGDYES